MSNFGLSLSDLTLPTAMSPVMRAFAFDKATLSPLESLSKYWGKISILERHEDGAVWKLIEMNAGTKSSLEYHVKKEEIYFLISGQLDLRLRLGRAEDHTITMNEGEYFKIPVGLMHQRSAVTGVKLLEWASSDDPKDSHIVEDGMKP